MTERRVVVPEVIIHGPRVGPNAALCKVIDSTGAMNDGLIVETPMNMIPREAMIMEAERVANSPVSIVTEAKKIEESGVLFGSGKPALVNSREYVESWERTFGKMQS